MVRVQAGRLRAKLAEYYATEGAEDPIRIELPKGTYSLSFHQRLPGESHAAGELAGHVGRPASRSGVPRNWAIAVVTLSALLGAALVALILTRGGTPATSAGDLKSAQTALQVFWKPFVQGPEEPWVVFSNAAFIGRPETGMRYFNAALDPRGSVHSLDQVFDSLHRKLRVQNGQVTFARAGTDALKDKFVGAGDFLERQILRG